MEKQSRNSANYEIEIDEELNEDALDQVSGNGINLGGLSGSSANIGKGSSTGNPGSNTNTPLPGGGGFSGPAVKRP